MPPNSKGINHIKAENCHGLYSVNHFLFSAGIGDGGNDVGMIQLASIGLGIVGKEGNHAALASDISMK
jgi:soluble P-type ATPase